MYILAGIVSQIMWITFSPILPIVEEIYGVGDAEVGLLSAVFPIVFIVLALPVGYYVDRRGFRKAVLLGSAFFAVFGLLRAFAATFEMLLAFQTLTAVGQPFIFNSILSRAGSLPRRQDLQLVWGASPFSYEQLSASA